MDATETTLQQIELLAKAAESLSAEQRTYLSQGGDAPNGKYYRCYNQTEVCEDLGGMNKRTLAKRIEELGIDPKESGARWSITLPQLQELRRYVLQGSGERPFKADPLVAAVANLKGGAGKTMTTVTAGVGLATQLKNEYRVAIIDADPQGTATMYLCGQFDNDTMHTVGDLISEQYDLSEGETFKDLCKRSFQPTNAPNLWVLPASVDDNYVELWLQEESRKKGRAFNPYNLLSKVIEAVKDDFDIILIDTGPSLDYKVMNALYAANSLIIPVQPHQNDQDATGKYLRFVTRIYKQLEGVGHTGYDFIKLLVTRLDRRSQSEVQITELYRHKFGRFMMNAEFINSEAVKHCSAQMSTIYDFSPHEYHKGKASLRNAQSEFYRVLAEIEGMLLDKRGLLGPQTQPLPKSE